MSILIFISYAQRPHIDVHAAVSSVTSCVYLGLRLHLHAYFVCASSEPLVSLSFCAGSSEPSLLEIVIGTEISRAG